MRNVRDVCERERVRDVCVRERVRDVCVSKCVCEREGLCQRVVWV